MKEAYTLYTLYKLAYVSCKYSKNPPDQMITVYSDNKSNLFNFIAKHNDPFINSAKKALISDEHKLEFEDVYTISIEMYNNSGLLRKFKKSSWNEYPESFMKYIVDPFELWLWGYKALIYDSEENLYDRITTHLMEFIIENSKDKKYLKTAKKALKNVNSETLTYLSEELHVRLPNKFETEYSFMEKIQPRIEKLLRENKIKKIKSKLGINTRKNAETCAICMNNKVGYQFHPLEKTNEWKHTICKECLIKLPKLECPFCRLSLFGHVLNLNN